MGQMTEERVGKWDWRIALITVPALVGFGTLSGWLSGSGYGNAWFDALEKPSFMPPGWLFGVVWPILYALLGIALALILQERSTALRRKALVLFFIQLALNYAWSPIFFAAHDMKLALFVIPAMALIAALATVEFWRLRPLAGALMLPYLAWLLFATALNAAFVKLNPLAGSSLLG